MRSIRVSNKHLWITFPLVNKLVVMCALQIMEKVLHSAPVSGMGIMVEATKVGDCIGNVWSSHSGQILKSTYSREIWHRTYFFFLFYFLFYSSIFNVVLGCSPHSY
jgi:hypothetical protein